MLVIDCWIPSVPSGALKEDRVACSCLQTFRKASRPFPKFLPNCNCSCSKRGNIKYTVSPQVTTTVVAGILAAKHPKHHVTRLHHFYCKSHSCSVNYMVVQWIRISPVVLLEAGWEIPIPRSCDRRTLQPSVSCQEANLWSCDRGVWGDSRNFEEGPELTFFSAVVTLLNEWS